MEKRTVTSTSRSSAQVSDINLRDGATARLVFRPELVDNPKDAEAAVRGTFLYQRKGPKETWSDAATIPLSSLKKGEGYKLELHATEVLAFFQELAGLYRLYAKEGIPLGSTELIRADSVIASLMQLPRASASSHLMSCLRRRGRSLGCWRPLRESSVVS